jgi:transcriptional regulator with XRE-family HTH domain
LLDPGYTEADRERLENLRSRLNIAHAVFDKRVELGLTQDELGRMAGTKQSRVSEIEGMEGNPRFDTLDRISRQLGLMVALVPRRRGLLDDLQGVSVQTSASFSDAWQAGGVPGSFSYVG